MKRFDLLTCCLCAAAMLSCDPESGGDSVPVPLDTPSGLTAEATENSILFSWNPVQDAKCYAYVLNDAEDEVYTNETSVTVGDLQPETSYSFRVKAVSGDLSVWTDSEWASTTVVTSEQPEPPFQLTVSDVTFYSANFKVIPLDENMTYFCNVILKDQFEQFASTDELVSQQVEAIKEVAAANAMTFEAYCRTFGLLNSGTNDFAATTLDADSEYVEFVFGLDYSGLSTSEVVYKEFRTLEEPKVTPSDMTFEFEVTDITDISARLTVRPSVDDEPYYCFFVNKENLDYLGEEYVINACLEDLNDHISSSDYATVVNELCHKGEYVMPYGELEPNSEYVGFAFGVGQHGLKAAASTRLFVTEPFMTKSPGGSDDPIRIEVINFGIEGTEIKFIPSPEVGSYRCELVKLSDFGADKTDEEILAADMDKLWNDYGDYYVMLLLSEEYTLTRINPLEPDTDYIAYAYGLSSSEFTATTSLCKKILRTPSAETSASASVRALLRRAP